MYRHEKEEQFIFFLQEVSEKTTDCRVANKFFRREQVLILFAFCYTRTNSAIVHLLSARSLQSFHLMLQYENPLNSSLVFFQGTPTDLFEVYLSYRVHCIQAIF